MGVVFSPHALERWNERFASIEESFRRAVPFGAQCGGDTYMLDGDRVFVVSSDGVVVTVLTKEMAIANMQQAGMCVDTSAFARKAEPPVDPAPIGRVLMGIISADDQELMKIAANCDSRYRNLCDYILSLRQKAKKPKR